jgi:hypothetical protein
MKLSRPFSMHCMYCIYANVLHFDFVPHNLPPWRIVLVNFTDDIMTIPRNGLTLRYAATSGFFKNGTTNPAQC